MIVRDLPVKKSPSSSSESGDESPLASTPPPEDEEEPYDDGIGPPGTSGPSGTSLPAVTVRCRSELLPGQFRCRGPQVDPETQQPRGCRRTVRICVIKKIAHFRFAKK